MDFLGDSNNPSAVDVISFVREVVEKFPELRPAITEKLVSTFGEIKSGKVFRGAMWIVGEYCTGGPGKPTVEGSTSANISDIKKAVFEMRKVLGEIPILASEQVSLVTCSIELTPLTFSACSMRPKLLTRLRHRPRLKRPNSQKQPRRHEC